MFKNFNKICFFFSLVLFLFLFSVNIVSAQFSGSTPNTPNIPVLGGHGSVCGNIAPGVDISCQAPLQCIAGICLPPSQPSSPSPGQTTANPVTQSSPLSGQTGIFLSASGFSQGTYAENIVATIIGAVLGLLAIVFVVLMIFSGFQWMTAGGNEEQVKKAQSRIKNAVIGLIIVVFAYAITAFIFKNLPGGSGGSMIGGGS